MAMQISTYVPTPTFMVKLALGLVVLFIVLSFLPQNVKQWWTVR